MCGIAGLWIPFPTPARQLQACVEAMAEALIHRGPDGAGVWCEPQAGFALAHRRLAILDLSPAGQQPMASATGRYQIAFNGQIYNHQALRPEPIQKLWRDHLEGHADHTPRLWAVLM